MANCDDWPKLTATLAVSVHPAALATMTKKLPLVSTMVLGALAPLLQVKLVPPVAVRVAVPWQAFWVVWILATGDCSKATSALAEPVQLLVVVMVTE